MAFITDGLRQILGLTMRLHELIRTGEGDSALADELREEAFYLSFKSLTDEERRIEGYLAGDLYMLCDQDMYRQTTEAERSELRLALRIAFSSQEWLRVIELLQCDLGLSKFAVAFFRSMAWGHFYAPVGSLFYEYSEELLRRGEAA